MTITINVWVLFACIVAGTLTYQVLKELVGYFMAGYRKAKLENEIKVTMFADVLHEGLKNLKGDMVLNPPDGSNSLRYPFKWKCKRDSCEFTVWATVEETKKEIRENHLNWHDGMAEKAGPL